VLCTALRRKTRKKLASSSTKPKVIWYLNLDLHINLDVDPDLCQIAPKILQIHQLVGISHFAECRENQPVTV